MEVLDSLLSVVRRCCEGFPDKRTGTNSQYTMADIGLAALSVFFTQSPSFLDHPRQLETGHGRSNCQTLFGISRIPTDNHIRDMLDPVAPDHLFSGVRRGGCGARALRRDQGLPAARLTPADRAGRHRVPPPPPGPLAALLPPPPGATVGPAPPAPEKASRPSPSTPCCAPPSWPRAVPRWSRSSRSSSSRKTVTTSRTARAAPCGAGSSGTAPATND